MRRERLGEIAMTWARMPSSNDTDKDAFEEAQTIDLAA
jgi:hypothetical protein